MIKNIWAFWVETWHDNKPLFWCEAVATIVSVIASFLLAFLTPTPPLLIIFICYLVGSVLLMAAMYMRKSSWMFVLMGWYSLMNIVGLLNAAF